MKIKVKKQNSDGIVKLESSGDLKELIFKEDFLSKENSSLLLCFKGKDSSGIIELGPNDLNRLYSEIIYRKKLMNETNVMKFSK